MRRLLAFLSLLAACWAAPAVAGETLACPELAGATQVNACPTEEELQMTYTGFCSDNARMYAKDNEPCVRYELYRKQKNVALWESKDGRFDGYVSCDLPREEVARLRTTGMQIAAQGKVNKVVCAYPQGVAFTHRTRAACRIVDAKACAADAAACSARCD
jgi:hypothetical protein